MSSAATASFVAVWSRFEDVNRPVCIPLARFGDVPVCHAPRRAELGQYVLGTLPEENSDYIRFHLETIGCRYCQANLADLQAASRQDEVPDQRRHRYFQTSAGYLKKQRPLVNQAAR